MKKIRFAIFVIFCLLTLSSCKQDVQPATTTLPLNSAPAELTYTVEIVDSAGKPVADGVVVSFLQGNVPVGKESPCVDGVAQVKLPAGIYRLELRFTDENVSYHHNATSVSLTPDQPTAKVILASLPVTEQKRFSEYDPVTGEEITYTELLDYVDVGYTCLELEPGVRHYVYFVPHEPGLYRFSVVESVANLGYYGSAYYIQDVSLAEPDEDGSLTINISKNMLSVQDSEAGALVLGVGADTQMECFIQIERISEPKPTIEDMPWDIYQPSVEPQPYSLPRGTKLMDFDLTATSEVYKLVLNAEDGFYHMGSADGPMVYAKLGLRSGYLDSIETILKSAGISRYFFDCNGDFLHRESYTECLLEYIANMDASAGVYPLTQDLVYIIQQHGAYVGWWDRSGQTYLFVDENGIPIQGVNSDIAWLFLCCYASD